MQQIPLEDSARARETKAEGGMREIAPDLAYRRLLMVNVIFFGRFQAGDRNWVLIDTGVTGSRGFIKSAAAARFGNKARPAAIILTHGHFDHVGALEELAEEWDVPVYAHPLEHPYLDGSKAYPPGDPSVGGGLMSQLSSLYPTDPVNVAPRLNSLPEDGSVPHMPTWQWIHTPGHSPGHISLWRGRDKTLIVGDAFVTTAPESVYATITQSAEIHGPPQYFTIDWRKAHTSVNVLAGLNPTLVVAGHGRAMQGPAMTKALHRLDQNFARIAVPAQGHYVENPIRY